MFASIANFMRFLLCLLILCAPTLLGAKEPFLRPNDVIALVGGEDMVVASELGYLEALVQRALPAHKLRFRALAWEGDTVFEQRRDLNYPTLEAQLEKMGATVVIAQFGKMESLGGTGKLSEFEGAAEALIAKLRGPAKRRLALIAPLPRKMTGKALEVPDLIASAYAKKFLAFAREPGDLAIDPLAGVDAAEAPNGGRPLTERVHGSLALALAARLLQSEEQLPKQSTGWDVNSNALLKAVVAKNRLWFNYSRPQNWAFLAGDRTNQPSSRDHLDRSKRWFPEELEKFVPLIEAKEKELWALAPTSSL